MPPGLALPQHQAKRSPCSRGVGGAAVEPGSFQTLPPRSQGGTAALPPVGRGLIAIGGALGAARACGRSRRLRPVACRAVRGNKRIVQCGSGVKLEKMSKTVDAEDVTASVRANEGARALAIVLLCFFVATVCSLDRAAMSVAILPMSSEFGYTDTDKGLIGSSYFWGYTLSNVLAGVLCTAVEPWLILAAGVVVWSAFTVATPTAAFASLPALLACRALMGVAEGVCLPTIQALVSIWVAPNDKSRALAFVTTGITAGTVGSLYIAPQIVASFGWPSVFLTFGALGFFGNLLWLPVASTAPDELKIPAAPAACEADDGYVIEASSWNSAVKTWSNVPWQQMANSSAMRGVVACAVAHNTSLFLLISWLPTYFAGTFGLSVAEASMLAAPPWIANFVVANLAGWAADNLLAQGVSTRDVRRGLQLIGSLGPALCLLGLSASGAANQYDALFWFTAALGLNGCSVVGFNAAPQDMARKFTAVVYGLGNAAGCIGGSLGVFLTGTALDANPDGGFNMVFRAAACIYLLGGAAFFATYRGEQEFE